jgi:alginate lyase
MACVLVCLIPLGMYLLLRATCPARRGWALVGVLCSLSYYLLVGFFNFVAGIGVALIWLAMWWPRRDAQTWMARLGLGAGLAGVFLVHLAGALTVLVVLGVAYLLEVWELRRVSGQWPPLRRLWTPRLSTLLVMTGVVAVLSVAWHAALGPEPPLGHIPPDFRSIPNKLANLASPFFALSRVQMAVMAGGYLASAIAFVLANRRTLRVDPMLASAVAFLLLFLVFPYRVDGAGYVDMRWLLPAVLLPFCATAAGPIPPQRRLLAIPFMAALAHAAIVHHEAKGIDSALAVYRRVLDVTPPGARLLPLVAENWPRRGRVSTYRHFALWHTIDGGGRVPGLLTEEERYGTNPPSLPHKFFGHFREPVILYYPDERWGTEIMFPLDWTRIDRDYDYIVLAGTNAPARAQVEANADQVARAGDVTLFRVRPGRAASAARVVRQAAGTVAAAALAAGPGGAATAHPPGPPSAASRPAQVVASGPHKMGLHPGGFYTQSQLDYVVGKVRSGQQPWAAAYDQVLASANRLRDWQPHTVAVYEVPGYYQNRTGFFAATNGVTHDADAAYVNAVAYRVGGDAAFAECAARILRAWAHDNTGVAPSGDSQLSMAEVGVGFVLTAELLSGYSGWSDADRAAFANWTSTVYRAQAANPIKDRTNNWGYWGIFGAVTADYYLDDAAGFADETARLQRHIDQGMAQDGHLPDETARGPGGVWYSYFALAPMTAAAHVIKYGGGPDLFRWTSPSGKNIKQGLDYLLQVVQNPTIFTYAQNPTLPNAKKDWWPYDLFEAMADEYGDSRYDAYAAQRRPIMNTGHHHAWTFPTLMKAPPDAM